MERAFQIGQSFTRQEASGDLIIDMAFASEEPYERWWGVEVLDIKGARLGRLNDGDGGPLLFNHNWDALIGRHIPGSVKAMKDGVLRGQVAIPQATQATRDAAALVESKTLTKASVGYQIHKIVEKSTTKSGEKVEREFDGKMFERLLKEHAQTRDGREIGGDLVAFRSALDAASKPIERADDETPVYIVVDWEPLEDSLVTVPADNTVGIGRSLTPPVSQPAAEDAATFQRITAMADTKTPAQIAEEERAAAAAVANLSAVEFEKLRRTAIQQLVKANRLDSRTEAKWITEGTRLEDVATEILAVMEERGKAKPQSVADLGMSRSEQQRYSLFRVLRMMSAPDVTQAAHFAKEAAFELECSAQVAKQLGRQPDGYFVPADILRRPVDSETAKRALTAQPGSGGGYLVDTENIGFIDILRNRSVLSRMGARNLSGLVGNVAIPRQTGAGTLVWQAGETTSATPSQQTLGQLSLTPKTAIAVTEIGRTLMLQSSPSAESMVTADLAQVVALGVDLAGIAGTGGAQPIGIINTPGITTGQDASTATYAKMLGFQSSAAAVNAILGNPGYVTTPVVAAALMSRSRFANTDTPLWDGNILDGKMCGFPAMSSVQIPTSDVIFGSWEQVVVGEWGVLELTMNPYQSFNAGVVGVRAIYTVDVLLRYPQAFVLSTNAS